MSLGEMLPEQGLPVQRSCRSRWFGPLRPGSLRSGLLVLTTTALGAGVLTLPYAVKELGWALGATMIALLGLVNIASLEVLLDAGMEQGVTSYHDLVLKVQGPIAAGFLDFTIIISNLGSMAAYLIFIKQMLPSLIVTTFDINPAAVSPNLAISFVAAICFVAALPHTITALSRMCFIGVVSVLYTSTLLLCHALGTYYQRSIMDIPAVNASLSSQGETSWTGISNAGSLIMLGFLCQFNVFFVCTDIKEPTVKRLRKITRLSTFFQMVCYMTLGVCGYIAFGQATRDNVYINFSREDLSANLGRFLMCGSLFVAVPLSTFSTRATLMAILTRWLDNAADYESPPHKLSAAASSVRTLSKAYAYSIDVVSDDGIVVTPASLVDSADLKASLLDVEGGIVEKEPLGKGSSVLHASLTFLILCTSLGLAMLLPGVAALLGKLGGFCGVTQMYVLPGLILARCQGLRPKGQRVAILVIFAAASLLGLSAVVL